MTVKLSRFLFAMTILCSVHTAWAAIEPAMPNAKPEALRLCQTKSTLPTDLVACQQMTSASQFVAGNALQLCSQMSMSGMIAGCIDSISNKSFTGEEIARCTTFSLDIERVACLKASGVFIGGLGTNISASESLSPLHTAVLSNQVGLNGVLGSFNAAPAAAGPSASK